MPAAASENYKHPGGKFGPGNPYRFQKGNEYRSKSQMPPDLLRVATVSKTEIEHVISKYLRMKVGEIAAIMKDEELRNELRAIDAMVISIMDKCIVEGCTARLEQLLIRTVGRPKTVSNDEDNANNEIKEKLAQLPQDAVINYLRRVSGATEKGNEQQSTTG